MILTYQQGVLQGSIGDTVLYPVGRFVILNTVGVWEAPSDTVDTYHWNYIGFVGGSIGSASDSSFLTPEEFAYSFDFFGISFGFVMTALISSALILVVASNLKRV